MRFKGNVNHVIGRRRPLSFERTFESVLLETARTVLDSRQRMEELWYAHMKLARRWLTLKARLKVTQDALTRGEMASVMRKIKKGLNDYRIYRRLEREAVEDIEELRRAAHGEEELHILSDWR